MNKPAHLMGGLTAGVAVSKYLEPTIINSGAVDSIVNIGVVLCGALLGSLCQISIIEIAILEESLELPLLLLVKP